MSFDFFRRTFSTLGLGALLVASMADAQQVRVTVTNMAAEGGHMLTPFWLGFHDGSFDLYDIESPATAGLERLAEDGNTAPLAEEFIANYVAGLETTAPGPNGPLAPGEMATAVIDLAGNAATNRYFSYASMFIPSNDAFIANGDPIAHAVFDAIGDFVGIDIIILGDQVRDAGTEFNDELPDNTAALNQSEPNTGLDEGGTVQEHSGFTPGGNVLTAIPNGDFTVADYQVARIQIELVEDATAVETTSWATVKANWNE